MECKTLRPTTRTEDAQVMDVNVHMVVIISSNLSESCRTLRPSPAS